jgi:hypothetical protein
VLRIAMMLLVAAMSTTHVRGEPAQGEYRTSMGPLNFSCGKWTNTPKRSTEHEVLKSWVLGYLSGVNFENADGDFLRGRDIDGVTAWIVSIRREPRMACSGGLAAAFLEFLSGPARAQVVAADLA